MITVTLDKYIGQRNEAEEYDCTSLAQIADTLDRLDGKSVSLMTVVAPECEDLYVAGGPEGFVLTTWDDDEGVSWILRKTGVDTGEELEVVSGGQMALWDRDAVIDRPLIDRAVSYYFEKQQRDPALRWVKDE